MLGLGLGGRPFRLFGVAGGVGCEVLVVVGGSGCGVVLVCWFCCSAVSIIEMRSAIAQRGCHFQQFSVCFSLSALIQICFISLSVLFIVGPFCAFGL